jgi:hypothetical protein
MSNDGQECISKPHTALIAIATAFKFFLEGRENIA